MSGRWRLIALSIVFIEGAATMVQGLKIQLLVVTPTLRLLATDSSAFVSLYIYKDERFGRITRRGEILKVKFVITMMKILTKTLTYSYKNGRIYTVMVDCMKYAIP